jgi:predicted amidohydrolase YtcJ
MSTCVCIESSPMGRVRSQRGFARHGMIPIIGLIGAVMAVVPAYAHVATADLVLRHGRVITVDAADSIAEAIAIRDGRILAVGSDAEIRRTIGSRTQVIDLNGRTATPGLIDTHAHISSGGIGAVYSVDLSDATSVAEIVRRVAARARTLAPGEWLKGSGWDEGKLRDGRYIEARDLDAVTPQNPVWLVHTTGHYGTANAVALSLAGIRPDTPDPVAGTIDRAPDGHLSGVLKESAQDLVTRLIPAPTRAEREAGILASLNLMHREGMTGVKDPSIDAADFEAYRHLAELGKLDAHVCLLWRADPSIEAAAALAQRLATLPRPPATIAGRDLMACGVKIFMDGSGGARTAWMYEDWNLRRSATDAGNRGYPLIDPEVFRAQVRLLNAARLSIGTHAIGDRAIDWVVDTYAEVLAQDPVSGLRHSIIHANIPTDHAIAVMAQLQTRYDAGYPESQGGFTWWIGDNYAGNFGPARGLRLNPFRTYQARGVRWGGGSDYDVTPLPARLGLWATVERRTLLGTYGAQPFGTSESVDIRTALKSYTIWAARQLFIEAEAGSLEVGKSADIAVWDRDPYTATAEQVRDLRCELTLFRGRIVHRAAAHRSPERSSR